MEVSPLSIYLPNNWEQDLQKSLKESPPGFKYKLDYFKYIGQLVYFRLGFLNEDELRAGKGFVSINKQNLQKRVREYRKHLDYLAQHEFIEEREQYIPGKFASGMRYPPKYFEQNVIKSTIKLSTLLKNILKEKETQQVKISDGLPCIVPQYLNKWLRSGGLTIDIKEAERRLEKIKQKEMAIESKKEEVNYHQVRFNIRVIPVHKISTQNFSSTIIDAKAGRLHTNLTSLKKELRGTLRYEGQELSCIDIVNSQPFLLLGLLDAKICQKQELTEKILRYNPSIVSRLWNAKPTPIQESDSQYQSDSIRYHREASIMLVNLISQVSDNEDVKKYVEWVCEGVFYDEFGEELVDQGLLNCTSTNCRKVAKETTFRVLFDRNTSLGYSQEMKAFNRIFPSVYSIIKEVKKSPQGETYHNTLALTLQAFEAKLILKDCCGTIAQKKPDLPIFTIHDSIVTTKGNEHYVQEIMKRVFLEQMGISPQMVIENWV